MSDRFYWNGSRYIPSGTTVIGQLDKEFLTKWAANCAVDSIWDNVLWWDIDGNKNKAPFIREDITDKARTAYLQEGKLAAGYGTFIHWCCEQVLQNKRENIVPIPETWIVPDEEPWELKVDVGLTILFMAGLERWIDKHNVKVIAMEREVVTDTYGGRLDLVCEMDSFWMTKAWCKAWNIEWYKGIDKQRVVVLIDFKTGKGTYYDTWKIQLALYRQAWNGLVKNKAIMSLLSKGSTTVVMTEENKAKIRKYWKKHDIQSHGILKFNKGDKKGVGRGNVNFKCFDNYTATRTNPKTNKKEKYERNYEIDRQTGNKLVELWWLLKRGMEI